MHRSLLLMLVAALLGAGLVFGCGGGDDGGGDSQAELKERFDEDYRELNDDLLDLGEEVGRALGDVRGKSNAALATQFTGLGEKTAAIKRRVDELEPPEDLEALTRRLSNAVGVAGSDLTEFGQAAENGDAPGARRQLGELERHSVELRTARRELARRTGATVERQPG